MIEGLVLLLAGQLIGEAAVAVFAIPIPGPVIGMLLVLSALIWRQGRLGSLQRAGTTVLSLVPLLLIPVSVGVMVHADALAEHWFALALALIVSMALGMLATGLTIRYLRRLDAGQDQDA